MYLGGLREASPPELGRVPGALQRAACALARRGAVVTRSEEIPLRDSQPRHKTRLDSLEISSWATDSPFINSCWAACLREYDLDAKVFTGRTQREAINELLDYYEQDNGEIRE
jgi:hypothetical protein